MKYLLNTYYVPDARNTATQKEVSLPPIPGTSAGRRLWQGKHRAVPWVGGAVSRVADDLDLKMEGFPEEVPHTWRSEG